METSPRAAVTTFSQAHATGDDWAAVAKSCADQLAGLPDAANLGLLYVSDNLAADMGSILTFLRQTTGIEDWAGTVGIGVCAGGVEYFDEPAAAVLVGAFPDESFRVFKAGNDRENPLGQDTQAWAESNVASLALVHGDPTNGAVGDMIEKIALDTNSFLVGGLTASRGPMPQIAGTTVSGGVSGVLFSPDVQVATGLTQGCSPLSEPHMITEAQENVIMTIDGEAALDVLKADMGELLARDLARAAGYIHAGFPIRGSDTRDYLVRNLSGIDTDRGWVAVGGQVSAGEPIMFVRRDPTSARQDLTAMLQSLKGRLASEAKGAVYYSCVARGANMFGAKGTELSIIQDILGDVPLAGFFGNGEISNARLYGYTGVLTIFT